MGLDRSIQHTPGCGGQNDSCDGCVWDYLKSKIESLGAERRMMEGLLWQTQRRLLEESEARQKKAAEDDVVVAKAKAAMIVGYLGTLTDDEYGIFRETLSMSDLVECPKCLIRDGLCCCGD